MGIKLKYRAVEGREYCMVHTKNYGSVKLWEATQTELKKLFQLGCKEVETYEVQVKEKRKS